jgi:cytochrome c biogenesis factor
MWKQIRIWILCSWSFLTVGILLGSWWAYHELGWGGWWFWDPVENASLMPWLLATACIHSVTKPKLNNWTLICAQATFIFSILGTFFVRSGLLSSVHSFATDSTRGLYLFFFLLSIIFISILNWLSLNKFQVIFRIYKSPSEQPSSRMGGTRELRSHPFAKRQSPFVESIRNQRCLGYDFWGHLRLPCRLMYSKVCLNLVTSKKPQMSKFNFVNNFLLDRGASNFSESNQTSEVLPYSRGALFGGILNLQLSLKERVNSLFAPRVLPFGRRQRQSTKHGHRYKIKNSLEQLLLLQNFYLCVICTVVFFGTSAPLLFHWLLNRDVGTGAPFYNGTLIPLFTSLFFILLYVHYIQFTVSNKNKKSTTRDSKVIKCIFGHFGGGSLTQVGNSGSNSQRKDDNLRIKLGHKTTKMDHLFSMTKNQIPSLPGLYFILLSLGHFFIGVFIIEFNFLDSIYASICFLLICSIIICTFRAIMLFLNKCDARILFRKALLSGFSNLYTRDLVFSRTFSSKVNTGQKTEILPNAAILPKVKTHASWYTAVKLKYFVKNWFHPKELDPRMIVQEKKGLVSVFPDSYPEKKESSYVIVPVLPMNKNFERQNGTQISQAKEEMNIAHTGIVFFILGIIFSNTFRFEFTEQLHSGGTGIRIGSQICCLRSIDHSFAPTFHSICANLLIFQPTKSAQDYSILEQKNFPMSWASEGFTSILHNTFGSKSLKLIHFPNYFWGSSLDFYQSFSKNSLQDKVISCVQPSTVCMFPEKRFYYSNQTAVATKVAIHSNLFTDFYSLIGTGSVESGWFTTIMKLPFIFCIWLGFFFGVIGGFLSLKKQIQKSKVRWI